MSDICSLRDSAAQRGWAIFPGNITSLHACAVPVGAALAGDGGNAFAHGTASHTVLTVFAHSMMGTVQPAYPASLPKA